MFSRPFRKHGVISLATSLGIYRKGDLVYSKGMGIVQKGMPRNVTVAKLEGSTVLPSLPLALL